MGEIKSTDEFLKILSFFILGCARCLLLCEFLSSCDEQGPLSSWGVRAARWEASPVAEHGLGAPRLQQLRPVGSVVAAPGARECRLSACGHTGLAAPWQVGSSRPRGPTSVSYTGGPDSLPLSREGSPDQFK